MSILLKAETIFLSLMVSKNIADIFLFYYSFRLVKLNETTYLFFYNFFEKCLVSFVFILS